MSLTQCQSFLVLHPLRFSTPTTPFRNFKRVSRNPDPVTRSRGSVRRNQYNPVWSETGDE